MSDEERFLGRMRASIERWPLPRTAPPRFAVAFSGGLDSTVLLAAALRLELGAVRALHVNHGLAEAADAWETHCREAAAALGAEYASVRVAVERRGVGTEAAARHARYVALAELMQPGEVLLTAHHADDQLETLLLRMMRGSGVRGLRGVLPFGKFPPGFLGRPLLFATRAEIRAAAGRFGLSWLEDPANQELRYDRNFLRHEVLPLLIERWPAAPKLAARLAAQMRDAETILEEVARNDAAAIEDLRRIPAAALAALTPARQRNLLRHALRELGIPVPGADAIERLRNAAVGQRPDAQTRLGWPGGEARVHRDHLYLLPTPAAGSGPGYRAAVSAARPWTGPEGVVRFDAAQADEGLPASWVNEGLTLAFRQGGERFRPLGAQHTVSLKHWLQERGIVPWMRDRIPLLFRGERLVAIGDLAVAEDVREAPPGEPRMRVIWTDHPPLQ